MEFIQSNFGTLLTITFATISFIVWLVRLEGKTAHNNDLIHTSNKRMDSMDNEIKQLGRMSDDISEIKTNFAWLKESLGKLEKLLTIKK